MDDDFQEDTDVQNYQMEAKAFERVSQGRLHEFLSTSATTQLEKGGRQVLTPEDRFIIKLNTQCLAMREDKTADISDKDIDTMLEKTRQISDLKYKNPLAYILGYIATKGGKSLKVADVKDVIKNILPSVATEGDVAPQDVVRYARFWSIYLNS